MHLVQSIQKPIKMFFPRYVPCRIRLFFQRFADEGLRTLVCAYREIPESEFATWFTGHTRAKMDLVAKSARVAESAELIEVDLNFLGATAVKVGEFRFRKYL